MAHGATRRRLVLGLDLGTQSLRAAFVDETGRTVAFGVSPIETTYPRPAWAEQQPLAWWAAAETAVVAAKAQGNVSADEIVGIGLDCTACTVLACDLDGNPLRPALLWMDQRSHIEADDISATADPVLRYVSGRVSPEWMLPKALWLLRNEPATFHAATRIVECTDWMMHRLTGEWTLSLNHVAVKWNYARPDGGWPLKLLAQVGLADLPSKWPERIVPLGLGEGRLCRTAAAALGLNEGTPVAQGGIDAYLGMLGLGATRDGDVAAIVGSSTCHLAQSHDGVFGSGAAGWLSRRDRSGPLHTRGRPDGDGVDSRLVSASLRRQGTARSHPARTERLRRARRTRRRRSARSRRPGRPRRLARQSRSPYKNPQARGAIVGLSLAHGAGHIFRAIYEATAMGTRHILENAAAHGLKVERVFIGGGGAKSALWLQIHADVLKMPMHLARESEACALGSAMTAAVAAGIYKNIDEAAGAMVSFEKTVEPDPRHAGVYDELFERYVGLYQRLNG